MSGLKSKEHGNDMRGDSRLMGRWWTVVWTQMWCV